MSAEAQALVAAMRSGAQADAQLVNRYYTLCIPFYREFLGDHWHSGFYPPDGPIGPADQLRMERLVAASAGVGPGCAVLDVGCGVGGAACHLARTTGAAVRGLTPNPAQLEIARAAQAREPALGVAFDLGYAGSLPYPDAAFDVVLFFESACHFPDRERFFAEAWRVLKPGGRLAGQDWLAAEGGDSALAARVCATWAIPRLGTVADYASEMRSTGFEVQLAIDMREEMALLRGFMATAAQRQQAEREMAATASPIRRMIIEGLVALGEAAERGAFTIGRFLARKP